MDDLFSPGELAAQLGRRARIRRIALTMRQEDLARAAGVGLSTLRRFESGKGSLSSKALAAVAIALNSAHQLEAVFEPVEGRSVDELLRAQSVRARHTQRVRRKTPKT